MGDLPALNEQLPEQFDPFSSTLFRPRSARDDDLAGTLHFPKERLVDIRNQQARGAGVPRLSKNSRRGRGRYPSRSSTGSPGLG